MVCSIWRMRTSSVSLGLILLCFVNLALVVIGFASTRHRQAPTNPRITKASLSLAFVSQLLYLLFAVAWSLRWMDFYPGNPIETATIDVGLLTGLGALFTAFGTRGWVMAVALFVGFVSACMWFLAGVASVAI